ncbi:hypothetical protein GCM10023187_11400 [Nibrella viscosa]|uniref:DUF4440 domain-containing protein n=1 Tax=Nibrella viscosa TaxID=1084524 RepID=A0ABP8K208_9BACT
MKPKYILLLLLVSFLIGNRPARAQENSQLVKQHAIDWMQALERKDFTALNNYLAAEYTLGGVGDGETVSRATWLKNAQEMDWSNTHYHFMKVHMKGDSAAMVNSRMSFKVSRVPFTITSNIIDFWVYRDGRWQITQRLVGGDSLTDLINMTKGFLAGIAVALAGFWISRLLKRRNKRPAIGTTPAVG